MATNQYQNEPDEAHIKAEIWALAQSNSDVNAAMVISIMRSQRADPRRVWRGLQLVSRVRLLEQDVEFSDLLKRDVTQLVFWVPSSHGGHYEPVVHLDSTNGNIVSSLCNCEDALDNIQTGKFMALCKHQVACRVHRTVKSLPVRPMDYDMAADQLRPDLRAKYASGTTTLDLIRAGERTATTRTEALGKVGARVYLARKGDLVHGVEIQVTGVEKLCIDNPEKAKAWVDKEGWSVEFLRANRDLWTKTQTSFRCV